MTDCNMLEKYLDNELPIDKRTNFKLHLETCSSCSHRAENWSFIEEGIQQWARDEDGEVPSVNDLSKQKIVSGFNKQKRLGSGRAWWILIAAAAAVVVTISGFLLMRNTSPVESKITPINHIALRPTSFEAVMITKGDRRNIAYKVGEAISVPLEKKVILSVGEDRIGAVGGTEITVASSPLGVTLIDLAAGTMVAEVEPRKNEGTFIVKAGIVSIRVRGTVFRVGKDESEGVLVSVIEGRVDVFFEERVVAQVSAGESVEVLADGEFNERELKDEERRFINDLVDPNVDVSAEKTDATDEPESSSSEMAGTEVGHNKSHAKEISLDELRNWIVAGRLEKAQKELDEIILKKPSDIRAWSLIAECKSRAGNWQGAVDAHREVIARAGGRKANTARFRAGVILQDKLGKHADAIELFEAFYQLSGAHPLKAASMLRRAKSHFLMGQKAQSEAILELLISKYPGTTSASEARSLLDE